MAKQVTEFERRCECHAWKSSSHYKYGPLERIPRPLEPNVTWHFDFMTGLTETGAGGAYRLYDTILTVTDRFSGMFWALPCNIRISASETSAAGANSARRAAARRQAAAERAGRGAGPPSCSRKAARGGVATLGAELRA